MSNTVLSEDVINELFEHPKALTELTPPPEDKQSAIGISGMKIFQDDAGERYVKYKRNGAWEVHHADKNGISGQRTKNSKFNPDFLATTMKLLQPHIDNGETVMVSATKENGLIDTYHRIAKVMAKRGGGKSQVTDPEDHPTDNDKQYFHIQPHVSEAMAMIQTEIRNSRLVGWSEKYDGE